MLALWNAITVGISNYLNVSSSSVTTMIHRLDENGYLNYEKYRGIRLTDDVRLKVYTPGNEILAEFFRMIGVGDETPKQWRWRNRTSFAPWDTKEARRIHDCIKDK